jgi:hypothetical protein
MEDKAHNRTGRTLRANPICCVLFLFGVGERALRPWARAQHLEKFLRP